MVEDKDEVFEEMKAKQADAIAAYTGQGESNG